MSVAMVHVQTPRFKEHPSRRVAVRRDWYAKHEAEIDAMPSHARRLVLLAASLTPQKREVFLQFLDHPSNGLNKELCDFGALLMRAVAK